MNWKSILMLLSTLFGGREKLNGGKDAQPETSFISGDEKFQSPQAYIPPNPVKYPDDHCQQFDENDEFDFVVVGAGAGGSTVARRLAEDPKVRVLLMEAGGDPPPQSDIPINKGQVDYNERWHFQDCVDTKEDGRGCHYKPAKVLGGCTIINAMNYVRGNRQDYDDWAKIGCTGWSYKEVLPYFKKSETFTALPLLTIKELKDSKDTSVADKKYHGTKGPFRISAFQKDPSSNAIREAITKALLANGLKFNPDVNGASQMGVTNLAGMLDSAGYRTSVARAYLLHVPDNLKVCKYSTALKLELNEKTVTGILFQYNATGEVKNFRTRAKKEYIISAGPWNSAPLLERSGIGNRNVLESLGIEVKHELAGVGENFQDQFTSGLMFKAKLLSEAAPNPFTVTLHSFASYINTTDSKSSVPDMELIGDVKSIEKLKTFGHGASLESIELLKSTLAEDEGILVFDAVHLRHPNPGSIHITQTEDPTISPKIITNHLTTKLERERIVKASRFIRKFMTNEALKPFNVKPLVMKECQGHEFDSEDEMMCQLKIFSRSLYHVSGVTAMGPRDNPNSVVDPQLRVIGLKNLRIVDSGVIPLIPRGHTTMPTIMIAEKAADMIKHFWK